MIGIYCLSCVLLAAVFVGLKVWPATRATLSGMQESFAVIGNADMDDDAKEAALRAGSIKALGNAVLWPQGWPCAWALPSCPPGWPSWQAC